ncbi:hypothetical protein D1013_02710 [Euzebyella marina]|uniref:ABM domain-containing protein n=1 Tax=Euzebyella marina TaxID=1761453 RepID=A0A3G2L289_9FLAO|nr:hypothetical protein [Euzebyella marina]AYN66368.1 hypothetical protein D1013_02710 [Euzebyella marina]
MERIVIVAYKPFKGKENQLMELSTSHWKTLHDLGLVSDRRPILMQAKDKTVIEVFGWKSKQAMEEAHSNPTMNKMWSAYAEVCQYIPIGSVEEANALFSEFNPLEI